MPWCPQCGAEYVKGIAVCRSCDVALLDQLPAADEPADRENVAGPTSRVITICGYRPRALGYIEEAWRLIRRHPTLLLLPILIAVFNEFERDVGGYWATNYTAYGRMAKQLIPRPADPVHEAIQDQRARLAPATLLPNSAYTAVGSYVYPVGLLPSFHGAQRVLWAAYLFDSSGQSHFPQSPLWPFTVQWLVVLLLLPLGAMLTAGYYGWLRSAVSRVESPWPTFWENVRSCFWRFFLYQGLVFVLSLLINVPGLYLQGSPQSPLLWGIGTYLSVWVGSLVALPFALGMIAIVEGDLPVVAAARRSFSTIRRDLATAVMLWVALWLACAVVSAAESGLKIPLIAVLGDPYGLPTTFVWGMLAASSSAALALLGVWLCLAQFLWYRDANPIPAVVPDGDDDTPPAVEGG